MTSLNVGLMKRYRIEIAFDLPERQFPKADIAKNIAELGFADVAVSGEGVVALSKRRGTCMTQK